jgi:hypothetical protein
MVGWAPITVDLSGLREITRPLTFAECYGTVGGFALGAHRSGMRMTACLDPATPALYEGNRELLGSAWDVGRVCDVDRHVDVVLARLPYEGPGKEHTELADVIGYAGRIKAAALVLAFPMRMWADGDGHGLIQTMRDVLQKMTVCRYRITYVLVDGLSCGSPVYEVPQCFVVMCQCPFGVEVPETGWLPTLWDAIGDLSELGTLWGSLPLVQAPTWWSAHLRTPEHKADGNVVSDVHGDILRATRSGLPFRGFIREGIRWTAHPTIERPLTHREAARLMGMPDAWRLAGMEGSVALGALWGTGPSVPVASWLLGWVGRSLRGEPGHGTGGELRQDGRWTYAVEVVEQHGARRQAERQWGSDWRDRL